MHHKKKRKLFVLYSIPINLCKAKHLVSYSISLGCMVALLLMSIVLINPNNTLRADAVEVEDERSVIVDNGFEINSEYDGGKENYNEPTGDTSNHGSSLLTNTNPKVSIDVSGAAWNENVDVVLGETNYREHEISISVSDVMSYAVMISGDAKLTPPDGGQEFHDANGATGKMMENYTWGYGWDDITVEKENMTYRAPTNVAQALSAPGLNAGTASFTKKLIFAAKFPASALEGSYMTANGVTLSVIANAQLNTRVWMKPDGTESDVVLAGNITDMHDISPGFCRGNDDVKTGYYIQLQDFRDKNIYTIKKLSDGNCWMQENLRLPGGIELDPNTSDVDKEWVMPASLTNAIGSWNASDTKAQQMAEGDVGMQFQADSGKWQPEYGNYYSWCAATAGTCINGNVVISNINATSSICPKGWHLPPNTDVSAKNIYGSFYTLNGDGNGTWQKQPITINGLDYNGIIMGTGNGTVFFPAAGLVSNDGLIGAGSAGRYWSSTAHYLDNAYDLLFNAGDINAQNNNMRYYGFSVRCVASY